MTSSVPDLTEKDMVLCAFVTGLTGLEPQPEACNTRRCTVEEVISFEDIWINEVDPTGHKYNITSCKGRRSREGWCNQTGNAHGGGIYTDNGSGGWHVSANVLTQVYHWMFTWQPARMLDMKFQGNWVDSPLYTNNAAASDPPVIVFNNTLVTKKTTWPVAAQIVMAEAGARRRPANAPGVGFKGLAITSQQPTAELTAQVDRNDSAFYPSM
jgi:hypothetical protein